MREDAGPQEALQTLGSALLLFEHIGLSLTGTTQATQCNTCAPARHSLHRGLLAMLGLLVTVKDGPLVEAAAAGGTVVGLLACVDPLVPHQPLALAEALAAHLAAIGLLPSVCPPVHRQVGVPAEALATLTGVRLLPSVRPAMHQKVLPPAEALPAVCALVGLLPGMAALVHLQVMPLAECLPALTAHIGPLTQVSPLMFGEVLSQGETLPALHTAKGLLLFVGSLVPDKVGAPTKAFSTLRALERLPERIVGIEGIWQWDPMLGGRKPRQTRPRAPRLLLTGTPWPRNLDGRFSKPIGSQPNKRSLQVFLLGFGLLLLVPSTWMAEVNTGDGPSQTLPSRPETRHHPALCTYFSACSEQWFLTLPDAVTL